MLNRNRQLGMTTLGWLGLLVVAGFVLLFAVKIGPVYMQSMTVRSILEQTADEAESEGLGKAQIYERIAKKRLINTVTDLSMADIAVSGQGDSLFIDANYEVRRPLLFNIDVVVKFEDMIVDFSDR